MRLRTLLITVATLALQLPSVARAQPAPPAPAPAPPAPAPAPDQPSADQPPADQPPADQPQPPADQPQPPPANPPPAEQPPAEENPPADTGESEAGTEGEGPDPSRPPPKGKGVIWGVITDPKLKEPMMEVQVSAIGTKFKGQSDLDGRYRLELPPGTYDLRFFFEQYKPVRIPNVKVTAGHVSRQDISLEVAEQTQEETVVEVEADKAATETQTLRRQRSAAVGDSVGRAEIAKTPDRNAAQSAQRVVGANIVGGRFVYVRGLGERYTNALLNGTPLPSPEPDVNAVPLDLFPSLVLDSLTIAKTFTPDSPGDFAGGSVRIETREIPGKLLFSPSVTVGFNPQSTFRDRLSYRGSNTDWLGFDSGLRAMPSLPSYRLTRGGKRPDGSFILPDDLEPYGEKINTYMSTQRKFTPPNHGASVVVGKGWDLGNMRGIGVLTALTYSRSFTIRDEIYREYDATHARNVDYDMESGIDAVRWGAFGSLTYAFTRGQKISFVGLRSQLADNTARTTDGAALSGFTRHQTRLSFISRELTSGQIRGEHELAPLNHAELDWNLSIARAGREEPNTRDSVWEHEVSRTDDPRFVYAGNNAQAGRHLWTDQGETAYGGGLDFTQPVLDLPRETKLKVGGLFSLRKREFKARRFNFGFRRSPDPSSALYCPGSSYKPSCDDALFTNDNIGPLLLLNESTQATDAYHANLDVYAGYFMGDISLTKDLRAVGGERIEATHQKIDPFDQFDTSLKQTGADLQSTDLLPSVGLVYNVTKESKVRVAVTRTVARPQLRELAPYQWEEVVGGRTYTGNPDLKITKITNSDLRFEFFPTLREVLAISLFAKHFVDPIETVIVPSGGSNQVTYDNSDSADLYGVELEARKSLEFLNKQLRDFSLISNLTLARSAITIRQTAIITHTHRALSNQAPYVLNIAVDYASDKGIGARLLYNVVGARIVEVGTGGLDDSYEQPRHRIDASVSYDVNDHISLKFAAENILNSPVLVTVGKEARDDNVARKYSEGAVYSVSAAYTY